MVYVNVLIKISNQQTKTLSVIVTFMYSPNDKNHHVTTYPGQNDTACRRT